MAELTVPQIDFSGIGQLPQIYKQAQADQLRQQTLQNLGQGGTADATALLKSGDMSLAQLGINMQNRAQDQAHQASQDAERKREFELNYKLAQSRDARANEGPVEQAAYRAKVAQKYGLDPNSPEGKAFIVGGQYNDPSSSKPIPVETIGGTKFMVRQPNGGYSLVDPSNLTQPQQNGAPPSPSSFPAALPSAQPATQPPISAPPPASGSVPAWAQPPQAIQPPVAPNGAPAPNASQAPPDAETVDPQTGRREGYLQSLDPSVRDYIKKVADYEIDPRTTSVKGGMREKLMSAVAKYDPAYNQNEFGARSKATKDFSTGTQGNAIRSFDVATDHLETLKKYVVALDNGNIPIINALRNRYLQETGSDLPTNVQAVGPIVGAEVSKAIIGSNNALADREELRKPLLGKGAPDQILGSIKAYQDLMTGQLRGLKKQYEDTTGKKDFDSRIRENTRNILLGPKNEPVKVDGYTITEH